MEKLILPSMTFQKHLKCPLNRSQQKRKCLGFGLQPINLAVKEFLWTNLGREEELMLGKEQREQR